VVWEEIENVLADSSTGDSMLNNTFLSDLSEAQCELRTDEITSRNLWIKNSLATNLLFFDHMYMGITDLLCNKFLYDLVFMHDNLSRALLCKHNLAKTPILQVISWDDSPFESIASRIISGDTFTNSKSMLFDRAVKFDRLDIVKTKSALSQDSFRAHYVEGLFSGLKQIIGTSKSKKNEVIKGTLRTSAIRLAVELHALLSDKNMHGKISQSNVWEMINSISNDPYVFHTLKKYSDLAYQATMSFKLDAALSLTTEKEQRFMLGVLLSEKKLAAQKSVKVASIDNDNFSAIDLISQAFPISTITHFPLEKIIELRVKGAFPALREQLSQISCGKKISIDEVEDSIAECRSLIDEMASLDKSSRHKLVKRMKREHEVDAKNLKKFNFYSGGGAIAGTLAGVAFGFDPLSSGIVAGAAGTAFFTIILNYHVNGKNRKTKYNLYQTAHEIERIMDSDD
jgi:hypothetical protein